MSDDGHPQAASVENKRSRVRENAAAKSDDGASANLHRWLQGIALVLLVVGAYWPALRGGFVWDDTVLIDRNSLVEGEANLLTIWFREDFPLSIVALWLQWLAWGTHAAGYHLVNVLLHGTSVLLLWRVLARLKIHAAWLGAALFAVHPVAVASVAWISELKNTLSLVFFLISLSAYVMSEDADGAIRNPQSAIRNHRWYWLALGAFLLALLSKTSTVMLPVVLWCCIWWRRGHNAAGDRLTNSCPTWDRDLSSEPAGLGTRAPWLLSASLRTAPFFALALAFGLMTIWFQTHHVITDHTVQSEGFAGRLAGAGWALWFYLGKALLPLNLAMIYPRWEINASQWLAWLPLVLWCGWLATCWLLRRGWGRHALLALVCFSALLFPVLGFFDTYYFSMSRVSDHFAYLALLPLAALAGAVLGYAEHAKPDGKHPTSNIQNAMLKMLAAVVVLVLAGLTVQRARVFATDEALWRDTLEKNPAAWVAHNNLGCILAEQDKLDEAASHFEASLNTNPDNAEAHRNLGKALVLREQYAKAEEHLRAAVQLNPKDAEAQRTLASALGGLGRPGEAVTALRAALKIEPDADTRVELANLLRRLGEFHEAIAQLRLAVTAKPEAAEALSNLAWILATASDPSLRNGVEAVQLAERACQLTGEKDAVVVATRAAAYAEAERFQEAVASAEKAIALANASGNPQFAKINQQLLRLYRARLPYHESPTQR